MECAFFSTSRIYNQRGIWVKSVQMLQFLAVGADEICTHQFWFVICFPIDVAAFQELNAERQGLAWGRINESGYLYIRIPGISGRRFPGFVVVVCRIFQKEVDQK